MSKILMFSNRLIIGGPSVHLLSLVEHFCDEHEICLLYGAPLVNEASMEDEFKKFNIKMHRIDNLKRSKNPIPDLFNLYEVSKIIKEFQPDIIHTHTFKPGVIGRILAKRYGVKRIIHTYHGLIFDSYFSKSLSMALAKMDKYLAKSTDVIIALSEIQQQQIISKIGDLPEDKLRVIPLSVSKKDYTFSQEKGLAFREEVGISNDKLLLGMVGRLVEVKNVELSISAFAELIKQAKNANSLLLIVGNGDQRDMLFKRAQDLGLNVELEKAMPDTDIVFMQWQRNLVPIYSAMDLLVLSSKNEGTPFNIIEAQMMQTAILAPRVGGIADIVDENSTALLFEGKVEMLQKMDFLLNNKNKLFQMKQNAIKFAEHKFSITKMLNSFEDLYKL